MTGQAIASAGGERPVAAPVELAVGLEPAAEDVAEAPPPLAQAPVVQAELGLEKSVDAPVPPRANADTMIALAGEIARKLDARSTRFELQLDPLGLGQVQVSLEITTGGEVSALLHFERPEAAAELRARAPELRAALEQSGFSLGAGSLNFESSGGRQPAPEQQQGRPARATIFAGVDDLDPAPLAPSRRTGRGGVDVRI